MATARRSSVPDGSSAAEGALSGNQRARDGRWPPCAAAPGQIVRVELPRRIDLYSVGGGRITLDDVVSDLPSLPKLDRRGT